MGPTTKLAALYKNANKLAKEPIPGGNYNAWQSSLQQVIDDLRDGKLKPQDLTPELFTHYKDAMLNGAGKGFKTDFNKVNYDSPDYALLNKMKTNLYGFAGAKTYSHIKEINGLMYGHDGKLIPLKEFENKASQFYQSIGITETKYKNWLTIEYNTAKAQGQRAKQWQGFMENIDIFPNVKYKTMEDEKVRHSHAILDNLVLSKIDPYLDKISPIKDWGCRCDLEETTDTLSTHKPDIEFDTPFTGNVGKDGNVISKSHPYYPESSKMKTAIQNRVNKFALQEHIDINKEIYDQYKADKDYHQMGFDENSGGFIIRHDKADGYNKEEQFVLNLLKDKGERIVLPELIKANYNKSFDAIINESNFDIKTITGDIKHRTEEHIRDAMSQAGNVVLYFPSMFDKKELIRRLGNVKGKARLNSVMIIAKDKVAVITKKEILLNDYSSLGFLK